jgi:two-component system nitrogen regulation response regulator GlnG
LLRVLADGEFFPVGAHSPTKVDVRIIAATHQNLDALVAEGRFREDLYHRLNVIRIHLPALRERRQDIPLLLRHFLSEASREIKAETKLLRPDVEAYLCGLEWPGNVRQLENTCRWITVMASGKDVHLDDLPPELLTTVKDLQALEPTEDWQSALKDWIDERIRLGQRNIAKEAIDSAEGILIRTALNATRGRRQEAAKLLGYGRNTLTRKIAELNLDV